MLGSNPLGIKNQARRLTSRKNSAASLAGLDFPIGSFLENSVSSTNEDALSRADLIETSRPDTKNFQRLMLAEASTNVLNCLQGVTPDSDSEQKPSLRLQQEVNMIVRKISKEELVQRRRAARFEKKKQSEKLLNTTLRDVIEIWHADLAAFGANLGQSGTRHESEPEGYLVPELPGDEVVGPYEDSAEIRLLLFARDANTPVVAYCGQRNKRSEERLRHSAKIRGWRLHYYRLTNGYIAIEVGIRVESDTRFLKSLGIQAV